MTALEQPPACVPDFAALKACRHPVAYAHELSDAVAISYRRAMREQGLAKRPR
jgi:hypothetical protein